MTTTATPAAFPPEPADAAHARAVGCPVERLSFCVVDLETTGGSPGGSRITEIGAVRVQGLRPIARFSTLVDPGCPIPAVVTEITGIDDALVAGQPPIEVALERFAAFAGQDVIVAHNAPFDLRFLNYERRRLAGRYFTQPWLDTLALARRLLEGRVPRHDLGTLAAWADTRVRPNHRALPDAEATADLLVRLLDVARARGLGTLAELRDFVGDAATPYSHKTALAEDLPAAPGVFVLRGADGDPLHVGGGGNLRRDVRRFFNAAGSRGRAVTAAATAAESVEHEVHGSRLGVRLRTDELVRHLTPVTSRGGAGTGRYIVLGGGDGASLSVASGIPRTARVGFGPLSGERTVRRAVDCLRTLFAVDVGTHAWPEPVLAGVADLLGGDARALGALGRRVESAAAAGRIDPSAPADRRSLDALTSVLHALGGLRRARSRVAVLVEAGPAPGVAEGFFVCGGAVVDRRLLPVDAWAQPAAAGLHVLRAARVPAGNLPVRARTAAMLIEERLAQRAAHPGAVRLAGAWAMEDALAALGRAVAAVAPSPAAIAPR